MIVRRVHDRPSEAQHAALIVLGLVASGAGLAVATRAPLRNGDVGTASGTATTLPAHRMTTPTTVPTPQPPGAPGSLVEFDPASVRWIDLPSPMRADATFVIARTREQALAALGLSRAPAWLDAFDFRAHALVLARDLPCAGPGFEGTSVIVRGDVLEVRRFVWRTIVPCDEEPQNTRYATFPLDAGAVAHITRGHLTPV